MVEVGPVIHGSSSKLQFQFDPLVFFLEWNCNFQNQMKALIAGFLWLLYIIFDFQDMDILLFFDQVSYFVNIIYISTYGTNADQVIDLFQCQLKIQVQSFFLHFFADTVIAFESPGFHLNKIPFIFHQQKCVDDVEFGHHKIDGTLSFNAKFTVGQHVLKKFFLFQFLSFFL